MSSGNCSKFPTLPRQGNVLAYAENCAVAAENFSRYAGKYLHTRFEEAGGGAKGEETGGGGGVIW